MLLCVIFRPKRTQEALLDPKSGRKFASTTVIKESGHLVRVPFTFPFEGALASVLYLLVPQRT